MRVASRNRTLAHIPRFEKMADNVARTKIVFSGLPEGYQTSFSQATHGIFIISSIADKKDESKCPLFRFWRVLVCDSLTRMSSTESSTCSSPEPMDLSGCFFKPSPNTSSSSSSSSGVRSLRRERRSSIWWARLERPSRHALWRNLSVLLHPLLVLPGE